MAGPGGKEVGRVSIRVLPDTSKFAVALKRYLERTENRLRLNLPVSLDQKDVAKTEAELEALTRDREINLDLDTSRLERGLTEATSSGSRGFGRMAGIIGAVAVAVAALTAALPAMLAIFGAPVAAAILGFDGIKKAASGLSDEVEHLKESLSGTFERLLTPGFERLSALFPVLEDGLGKVAEGVSEVFDAFSRSITTNANMKILADIFDRIGTVFQDFARLGGMEAFVNSILKLADAGTKAAESISPEFVATFTAFNDQLDRMAKNGDLANAMEGIGHAIVLVVGAFGVLVIATLEVIAFLERTGERISRFFGKTVPEGVAAMKTAIVSDFNSLMSFLSAIPGRIVGFFAALPGQLLTIGANAAQGLWDGLKGKIDGLMSWLSQKANEILGIFGTLWNLHSPSVEFRKIGQFAGEGLALGFKDALAGVEASATLVADSGLRAARAASFGTGEPTASSGGGRVALTITNWQDGTGYFGEIADGQIAAQESFASTTGRMAR